MAAYVYLIHMDQKMFRAQHYLGYTSLESVDQRLKRHLQNHGARMLAAANGKGITYRVVRVWKCDNWRDARALERKLKGRKNAAQLCPVCLGIAVERNLEVSLETAMAEGIPF